MPMYIHTPTHAHPLSLCASGDLSLPVLPGMHNSPVELFKEAKKRGPKILAFSTMGNYR